MNSRTSLVIRVAKLEAELDAERKRSAEFDRAHRKQLDRNRALISENATLRADLRHLNETTVPGLQRSLEEVKDELAQERTKLLKHLTNEARSARNREANAMMDAATGETPPLPRSVVKQELAEHFAGHARGALTFDVRRCLVMTLRHSQTPPAFPDAM